MKNREGKKFTPVPLPEWARDVSPAKATLPHILGANDLDQKVAGLRVLFVGAGAVGSPVMSTFAQMQVGSIYIVDPKRYRMESLASQLTDRNAVGCWKAQYRAETCKSISPGTEVRFHNGRIQEIDLSEFGAINLIILASDNLNAEIYTADLATKLRCPLIHGSVHAETTVSHVKTFSNRNSKNPCLVCGYNEFELSAANAEIVFSCEPGLSRETSPQIRTIATNCLPSTSANCAAAVASQALKLISGFGKPVENTLHEYCAHTCQSSIYPLRKNPNCHIDHESVLKFHEVGHEFGQISITALAKEIGMETDCLVSIPEFDWVDPLYCGIGHLCRSGGFVAISEPFGGISCPVCQSTFMPWPLARRDTVTMTALGNLSEVSLAELGVAPAPWIRLEDGPHIWLITPKNQI